MKISKLINYIGWASGIFGGILILCGVIGFFTGAEFLGVRNFFNWFYLANSFIFLGIFLVVATRECCCCSNEEEKK